MITYSFCFYNLWYLYNDISAWNADIITTSEKQDSQFDVNIYSAISIKPYLPVFLTLVEISEADESTLLSYDKTIRFRLVDLIIKSMKGRRELGSMEQREMET